MSTPGEEDVIGALRSVLRERMADCRCPRVPQRGERMSLPSGAPAGSESATSTRQGARRNPDLAGPLESRSPVPNSSGARSAHEFPRPASMDRTVGQVLSEGSEGPGYHGAAGLMPMSAYTHGPTRIPNHGRDDHTGREQKVGIMPISSREKGESVSMVPVSRDSRGGFAPRGKGKYPGKAQYQGPERPSQPGSSLIHPVFGGGSMPPLDRPVFGGPGQLQTGQANSEWWDHYDHYNNNKQVKSGRYAGPESSLTNRSAHGSERETYHSLGDQFLSGDAVRKGGSQIHGKRGSPEGARGKGGILGFHAELPRGRSGPRSSGDAVSAASAFFSARNVVNAREQLFSQGSKCAKNRSTPGGASGANPKRGPPSEKGGSLSTAAETYGPRGSSCVAESTAQNRQGDEQHSNQSAQYSMHSQHSQHSHNPAPRLDSDALPSWTQECESLRGSAASGDTRPVLGPAHREPPETGSASVGRLGRLSSPIGVRDGSGSRDSSQRVIGGETAEHVDRRRDCRSLHCKIRLELFSARFPFTDKTPSKRVANVLATIPEKTPTLKKIPTATRLVRSTKRGFLRNYSNISDGRMLHPSAAPARFRAPSGRRSASSASSFDPSSGASRAGIVL